MPHSWLRLYSEFAHDPKVQMMPEAMQRRLIMLMCEHCDGDGSVTSQERHRMFQWRISDEELAKTKSLFIESGFMDENWNLLNWSKRQFVSDSSKDRTRRWRERIRTPQKTPSDVTVTASDGVGDGIDTDTDTDTDKTLKTHPLPPQPPSGGVAEQPGSKPAPSGVCAMPPPSWKLTEGDRNLVDLALLASPPGIVAGLTSGAITPPMRALVIAAAKREAMEHRVSHGEALDALLKSAQHQAASIPVERLNLCGGFEKYFPKGTYRKDPIHFQERSNGASKGAGTIAAARTVLAKDRAKETSRLGGNDGTAAGMLALAGRIGATPR